MTKPKLTLATCNGCRKTTWVRTTDNLCPKCATPEARAKRWQAIADSVGMGDCFGEVKR